MTEKQHRISILPAILIVGGIIALVAVGSLLALNEGEETIQGQAEADEYRVSGKVPGRLLEIRVREGQYVKAGDTLAILEAPEVEAKYTQAAAAEAAAAAQRDKAERGAREQQVRAAREMWHKAKAGKEIAEKSYERIKRLCDEGVMTQQKLDEVTAQRDGAVATERAARAQYDLALAGAQREDRRAAAAMVDRARGAVSEVEAYRRETVLIAAHDGEVTDIYPKTGELVGTGAPVMTVAMMQNMWVTFNVREDHLSRFAKGSTVHATIPALGDKEVDLKVYYLKDLGSFAAWKATKTTGQFDMRTFEVKAVPLAPVEGLRPGMSVITK